MTREFTVYPKNEGDPLLTFTADFFNLESFGEVSIYVFYDDEGLRIGAVERDYCFAVTSDLLVDEVTIAGI